MQLEFLPGAVYISMHSYVEKILDGYTRVLEYRHTPGRKGFFWYQRNQASYA
jgi:hypothetical protein